MGIIIAGKYFELTFSHRYADYILKSSEKEGRKYMREHYIGYEDKKGAHGHRVASRDAGRSAQTAYKKANKIENDVRRKREY